MIEINNLVKKYGDHTAVDHLVTCCGTGENLKI